MLRYYEIIQEINAESEEKFKEFVKKLKENKVCLILFGSRAKGKNNLLSDFDLLIIADKFVSKLPIDFPADVFCYTVEECLEEIEKKNTVILDAFTQGELIFDNAGVFNLLKKRVKEEVERSGLVRSKEGWLVNDKRCQADQGAKYF